MTERYRFHSAHSCHVYSAVTFPIQCNNSTEIHQVIVTLAVLSKKQWSDKWFQRAIINMLYSKSMEWVNVRTTHPDSFWPMWVSYNSVPMWLLQVGVPLRVLWEYSATTGCAVASVIVVSEYPYGTLKGTPTCSSHSGTV